MIHGTANRQQSEKYGLKVYLCGEHHRLIHTDRKLDLSLICFAQTEFEKSHTRDEFRRIFGKSYL